MTLLELLGAVRSNSAIIQDDETFGYDQVLDQVAQLRSRLSAHRRVLVVSSEAVTVLAALAACQSLDIPIWIGHEFAGSATLNSVSQSQRIDVWVVSALGLAPQSPSVSEREERGFAVHIMTSGTTGAPKIARHAFDSLMGRVISGPAFGGSWLLTYPPSTFAGLQVLLTAVSSASTLVTYRTQSVLRMAEAIAQRGITHVSATPTFWRAALMVLLAHPAIPSLRQITIGGETVDQMLLNRLAQTFPNARITHIYASTEAGALFSVKDSRAGFPSEWLSRAIDGVEVRIQDGLLEVRSPRTMRSYVSGHSSPYREDGWLRTGDMVEVRGDRVHFLGRKDQVINVGGAKVAPEEVEKFIIGIEGVADARVSGARNPLSGAVLQADVVANPGVEPEELRGLISQRCHSGLPSQKVPRIIRIVGQLEVSAAGKKSGGSV
jgi:acyl-CoA synthetase (AMP-forming)/AMP-acid ligase II